ncbi:MAG: 4Fe-4S dicluster domain-containing protein [Sandaracinaceae bacterium]|nr:4Fe-4S dicluster domain-containing protein [Sandaracinaceae bacterium]
MTHPTKRIARAELDRLFALLSEDARVVHGPTVRDGAIVDAPLASVSELPIGWTDQQAPGRYRLTRRDDAAVFGFVVGPSSPKPLFFPPEETLYRAERRADGKVGFVPVVPSPAPKALLGVRACDVAAMRIQDRVFRDREHREPRYAARRDDTIVVGVHCLAPGPLCFCASMGAGPRVGEGADLALAERLDAGGHIFLVEALTARGQALLSRLEGSEASDEELRWRDEALASAERSMGRTLDTAELPGRLYAALDHPRWEEIASRCLACGSCTSVCPSCFCSGSDDPSDLEGAHTSHTRHWESCFTSAHGELHGHTTRPRTSERYRQWATHKFGAWVSQMGQSGCVGCGRCIAWCPSGIDLVAEVRAIADGVSPVTMPVAREVTAPREESLVPRAATVLARTVESSDVVTLSLRMEPDGRRDFAPGQFHQLSLPGVGEAPISISGDDGAGVEHTIRAVGKLTEALCALRVGAQLGVRGPYGRGWPMDELAGGPVVVVAGGIGLAPLREALRRMLADPERYPDVRLFYGARTPEDLLYGRELLGWIDRPGFDLHVTVDRAGPTWRGHVGVVTRLLRPATVPASARAILCGPEVMMRFTVDALAKLGLPHTRQWVTMERHMKCATGTCGRCQYGPHFVCKDGPVFRFDEVSMLFGRHGL